MGAVHGRASGTQQTMFVSVPDQRMGQAKQDDKVGVSEHTSTPQASAAASDTDSCHTGPSVKSLGKSDSHSIEH